MFTHWAPIVGSCPNRMEQASLVDTPHLPCGTPCPSCPCYEQMSTTTVTINAHVSPAATLVPVYAEL